jgi:hypothetical protein
MDSVHNAFGKDTLFFLLSSVHDLPNAGHSMPYHTVLGRSADMLNFLFNFSGEMF